jgi:phosphate transport system permease protein
MLTLKTASTRKAKRRDKLARWVITLGGITVIASVVAIVALIVGVTLPLFRTPQANLVCTSSLPDSVPHGNILQLGIDLDLDDANATGLVWSKNATLAWIDLRTGKQSGQERLAPPEGHPQNTLRLVESLGSNRYSLSWSDGAMSLVEIVAPPPNRKDAHAPRYTLHTLASVSAAMLHAKPQPSAGGRPTCSFIRRSESGAITCVSRLPDGKIAILRQVTTETPMGDEETSAHKTVLTEDIITHISALTLDREGNTLYAGTDDGRLIRWQFDEKGEVSHREVVRAFPDGRAITALAIVLGDVSLAVGDAQGGLTTWSPVNADGTRKLRMIHRLESHESAVRQILPSGRSKSLLSLSEDGVVHLDHMTSERHLLSMGVCGAGVPSATREANGTPAPQVALGPRGDAILALDGSGELSAWRIDGGCAEISFKTLFGRVAYEGYDTPEYVWQTTGGEDFEPKYSLVPLVFGTLKGTFYAMFFAVPLALFDVRQLFRQPELPPRHQADRRNHGDRAFGRHRFSDRALVGPDHRTLYPGPLAQPDRRAGHFRRLHGRLAVPAPIPLGETH